MLVISSFKNKQFSLMCARIVLGMISEGIYMHLSHLFVIKLTGQSAVMNAPMAAPAA